jgi:NCAIR mutase (PurE)-related protein
MKALAVLPYEDIGFAKIDHHRTLRRGFPEVIFGLGKTPSQIGEIARQIAKEADQVLITRASPAAFRSVRNHLPQANYSNLARVITFDRRERRSFSPGVLVISAGTADLRVAEEAALTAEIFGCEVIRIPDVGVAGIHRLLDQLPTLRQANVLIVVAGMEGALPSVVGGLVDGVVIAVPTSIGYGANFQGLSALLGMLNSCVPGIAVVNIDNGFGAGYLAANINLKLANSR